MTEMVDVQLYLGIVSVIVLLGNVKAETVSRITVYKRFRNSHDDSEVTAPSRLACVIKCLNKDNCLAITFSANTKTCILTHQRILFITEGIDDDQLILVRSAPGLHVQKNIKTKYEYTHTEAVNVCALLGAHLMTLDELQKVFDDGYSFCRCGWLAEGVRRYPMQKAKTSCGNTIGLVNCDHYSKTNAWCLLN